MKLNKLFAILIILLTGIGGTLCYLTFQEKGWLFYAIEVLLLLTLLFLIYFYRRVIKPLHTIGNGMELLREQDFSSRLSPVGQPEADRIVELFNKLMTQLKNERLHIREQNHFLDLLISASPMGVVILDFDRKITSANQSAVHFLGYTSIAQMEGKTLSQLDSPLAEEIARIEKDGTEAIRLSDSQIYRCSNLTFVDQGFYHPFILIESLTDEVMKAEKKAYEKVIRMISHEVNNTVASITSSLDTASQALKEINDTDDLQEVMKVCSDRCMSMSRFITNFADVVKIPEPQIQIRPLNEIASACARFMEHKCAEHRISLHTELDSENPQAAIDTTLFEQVLVNILKNAIESIGNGGEIFIRTKTDPLSMEIADNGKGIDKETEKKLFTPFFSTKPNGQGIGLIFIREVLIKHGCTFSLRTYNDGITRFYIQFPDPKSKL
ncbi:ATP-binding protein [uncultured Bacteroides sp.]|uniref:sensor histidine kinase n=1 Tax=uncultured Bacteroides sp. TaxID=162156 RepID=UPI002609CB6D|nr:ATP-binding protein [uncultured Bacteroides sp.]